MPPRAALLLILMTACTTEVASGRARTTATLRLATRVHAEAYKTREQVGSVQYTGSGGQAAGSAAIYADRTHTRSRLLWRPYQGDEPISDEDFFRFVGDEPAAAASRSYRRRGRILVGVGIGSAIVGSAALITGLALRNLHLTVGGAIGSGIGPSVAYFGFAYLHPENHAMPYDRAAGALEPPGQSRGRTVPIPLTVTGAF